MPDIRVTYTGIVSFFLRLAVMAGNMAFLLVMTRSLSTDEYGAWGIIGSMLAYAVVAEVIVGYWVSREIARGKESGPAALATSGILSVGGTAAYVLLAVLVGAQSGADPYVLLLAAALVPLRYVQATLSKINLSWRPHTTSYALVVQSVLHVPLSLLLIYQLDWGIAGAVATVLAGQAACCAMLAAYAREKLRGRPDLGRARRWFRLSWVSIYPTIAAIIFRVDVLAVAALAGSVTLVASWTAVFTVAFTITHASQVATALYPRLLGGTGAAHVRDNMALFFYLGIPLAAVIIVLARPIMYALNPAYEEAHLALSILSVGMFLTALTAVLQLILEGNEDVDSGRSSGRDILGSRLFLVPTVNAVQYLGYIGALAAALLYLGGSVPDAQMLLAWACIATASRVPAVIYQYVLARRDVGLEVGASSVARYLAAAACAFGAVYLLQGGLPAAPLAELLPALLGLAAAGTAAYAAITCAIDGRARGLAAAAVRRMGRARQ
ncbi:MAG: hypothetical protein MPJ05_06005 [Nitrosopumilus sp.]|nr:hypothetical protein [Nitrosopumilus sp.]MDA7987909.1 hypothetical protein [Alphaproteobacteria bacterium]CAI9830924.1 conserved membrane hypothetical protein [Nitrosopumilaceae archaeon]MDA7944912.1 hypothetical protein [Nitrosopumilus sp.]MDA7953352.1 hypothetical protein [Nitrosopumilus sp.]